MATRNTRLHTAKTKAGNGSQKGQDEGLMQGYMARGREQVTHYVSDYPLSSVLMVFGAGLGFGIALGMSLGAVSWTRRQASLTERLGQQVLGTLRNVLPGNWAERITG
jgi:hypothetical protein